MLTRNGGASSLPFYSTPTSSTTVLRIPLFIPRSCLSPRIFLSCILLTFCLSWLMLYSYSHLSLGFASSFARDNAEWVALEQLFNDLGNKNKNPSTTKIKTTTAIRWSNTTLTSRFNCQSTASILPSVRGSGYNRETICTVQNLCVDSERGAWINPAKDAGDFPRINVVAADPGSDAYYRPMVLDHFPAASYRLVDETIFLYGRDPTNGLSWTMNNLLPLHSVMSNYGGSQSSWFMRVSGEENNGKDRKRQYRTLYNSEQDPDVFLLAPQGREIVLDPPKGKPLAHYQISSPSKSFPTCFTNAVIGLQSRCTRPFCENLVGGSDLTESLRTKALDALSPSMVRFQKPDPDIVHPPSGENIAVVSSDNLTLIAGETAPRAKIQVGLLGRYGNTSIPNANLLELSLLARGFDAKTIHLDRPSEISLGQAAQLFRNQSILVAPQGDGLGYAGWMAPGTVVISILPRFTRSSKIYTDRMMAFGKRFFAWDCQYESCVQPDRDLAHECIEAVQDLYNQELGITPQEFEDFVSMKEDFRKRSMSWKAIADCYTRDVSRRLDVEELATLIEGLAKDFTFVSPSEKEGANDEKRGLKKRQSVSEHNIEEDVGEDEEGEGQDIGEDDSMTTTDGSKGLTGEDLEGSDEESSPGNEGEGGEESGEEDINVHPYDPIPHERKPEEPSDGNSETSINDKENLLSPAGSQQQEKPEQPAPSTAGPKIILTPSGATPVSLQHQTVRPMFSFAEFCRQGHCCGSVKMNEQDISNVSNMAEAKEDQSKSLLTPCAASMSRIVFGPKGVWGLADEPVSIYESQRLIWEIDLGRGQRS
ncbi:hypothetical protein BX616_003028 [Lobosporangium transversale]|uniref:Glycosyltransferase family 61 protein n=1 Tax=Lobosporangium transversale TaxID=64571 RepID=A0A1Y2GN88_9FUNG|nr:hypothetical protein BCR41DRAFT_386521 [Lobosporangium transversale]KAF9899452.1 hypothetical protein BX616_003028 [Lobosporangium transversale]ORZ16168.1 hypothetical protein BCR41DRAFT_386521 [Lobosporangium transversale]|eukprot:XP_021881515.1 hypothetical protein BCR41DRAFT_386521 [Lobosporangium transversale]